LTLAAVAVAGVLVAALAPGGKTPSGSSASTPRTAAHRPAATTRTRSATSTSETTATSDSTPSPTPPPSAASSGTPAGAVEQFYTAAARHDYAAAWALAAPNLRSQLGGYTAFQHLLSSVRSITFQSAQVTGGSSSSAATVALSTTSVQTDRTQHCTGTARTVRSGTGWLLDHISINCS
jgi:hypothetical protein